MTTYVVNEEHGFWAYDCQMRTFGEIDDFLVYDCLMKILGVMRELSFDDRVTLELFLVFQTDFEV